MTISLSTDDIPKLLVLLLLAAVLGYLADLFTGGRAPLGFVGAILFGLIGAWLAIDLVRPHIPTSVPLPGEPILDGVLLMTAGIGAFVFSLLWCTLSARVAGR